METVGDSGKPQQLPPNVQTLWVVGSLIFPALLAIAVVVAYAILSDVLEEDGVTLPPVVYPLAAAAALAAVSAWWAVARYRRWSFALNDEWLEANWGVLSRHTAIVPRNRVQTISLNNGPLDRMLDLDTIVIHTAGAHSPNLSIPHIRPATVRWLKQELGQGLDVVE